CGDGGYVYGTDDPTAGVTVLDAGIATTENLLAIKALSENHAVAVGENDAVVFTRNKTNWTTPDATPASGVDLRCIELKSTSEWWVGASDGTVYYTVDTADTWLQDSIPGTGWTIIYDIHFSAKSVGYIAGARTIAGTARGQ